MKKHIIMTIAIAALTFPAAANAMSSEDFVRQASIGNRFEITSSQVALQDADKDDVKQFAQQMIDDHTKVANQLDELAASSDNNIPQPAAELDSKHEDMLSDLEKTKKHFDKKYVDMQVKAHDEAIALFKNYVKHGDNEELRKFAADALPVLEEHRQHIKQIKSSL